MQLTKLTVTLVGLFTAAIQAAPTVPETGVAPPSADSGYTEVSDGVWYQNKTDFFKADSFCNSDYEYWNKTSENSPLVLDCWHMYNNIKEPGNWVGAGGHKKLISKDSCAYTTWAEHNGLLYTLGNEDLRLTIKKAIQKFGTLFPGEKDYKIGAYGKLRCQALVINWEISQNS
ncbi:Putative protein of unknown function [Podospora comata]|uniref:Ecp2 effector protein-like domain-containing protein n=1 Tax=Podospora comata TaxID=48703 RepID=A0ABY6SF40_PODCO|nr:Putative protein of unknown function [Podospora comata]